MSDYFQMPTPPTSSPPDISFQLQRHLEEMSIGTSETCLSDTLSVDLDEGNNFVSTHLTALTAFAHCGLQNIRSPPHDGWVYLVEAAGPNANNLIKELLCAIFRHPSLASPARFIYRFSHLPDKPNTLVIQRPSMIAKEVLGFVDQMAVEMSEVFCRGLNTSVAAMDSVYGTSMVARR